MNTVTVSPKFQVVIPKEIREQLGLSPGQKIQMIAYRNRIELVPVRPVQSLKGILKGIETRAPRDKDHDERNAPATKKPQGRPSPPANQFGPATPR